MKYPKVWHLCLNFRLITAWFSCVRIFLNVFSNILELYCILYFRLGCLNFTNPPTTPTPQEGASRSLFFPDGAIFQGHPRFRLVQYENTPMQYTAIIHRCRNDNFQMKNCNFFYIFAHNIYNGYTLELPQCGGSYEYPKSMF